MNLTTLQVIIIILNSVHEDTSKTTNANYDCRSVVIGKNIKMSFKRGIHQLHNPKLLFCACESIILGAYNNYDL